MRQDLKKILNLNILFNLRLNSTNLQFKVSILISVLFIIIVFQNYQISVITCIETTVLKKQFFSMTLTCSLLLFDKNFWLVFLWVSFCCNQDTHKMIPTKGPTQISQGRLPRVLRVTQGLRVTQVLRVTQGRFSQGLTVNFKVI